MKQLPVLFLLLLLTGVLPARADGADDAYVTIYNTMQEAENLESNGQGTRALAKYVEAQTATATIPTNLSRLECEAGEFSAFPTSRLGFAALSTQPAAPGAAPTTAIRSGQSTHQYPPSHAQRSPL